MASALTFREASTDPAEAVSLTTMTIPKCESSHIFVKMLAAPVNPLDMLVLQGKYPIKPQNSIGKHMIAGSDGVGEVIERGSEVSGLEIGDRVILKTHCRGSWRTHALLRPDDVLKVPKDLDPKLAAILRMGIMPAYFQLEDYYQLRPGDWILQNAGTSTIAHFVAQFAFLRGVKVASIIRDRDGVESVKRSLKSHGASVVITESELETTRDLEGKRIVLAIDSVSGPSSVKMAAKLSKDSTFLTTGFLAGPQPTPPADWKALGWGQGITFKGFRLSSNIEARTIEQCHDLVLWFTDLINRGLIRLPLLDHVEWKSSSTGVESRLKDAVRSTHMAPVGKKKAIFVFDG